MSSRFGFCFLRGLVFGVGVERGDGRLEGSLKIGGDWFFLFYYYLFYIFGIGKCTMEKKDSDS